MAPSMASSFAPPTGPPCWHFDLTQTLVGRMESEHLTSCDAEPTMDASVSPPKLMVWIVG